MNDDISALATRDLTISFGGQVAVNAVTCAFRQGTLTAIVGPNGAGKTTYFNLISGQLQPSNGSVSLFGADITRFGAPQRARRGLGRAFQLTNLYPNLSVFENVRLAVQSVAQIRFDLLSIAARNARLREEAVRWLDRVKLTPRAALSAAALSHGDQRKLEVAILLALKPRVFMFDEPTAGMSLDEVPVILDLIDEIKLEGDKTVLLVEHRMDVIKRLADRIVVLQDGAMIADGPPAEVVALPRCSRPISACLGRNGAGKTTTLRTVMGLWKARAGAITFDARSIAGMETPDIARLGIAYVPENMGIFGKLTVRENMLLATGAQGFAKDHLDRVLAFFPALKLKWDAAAGSLSGGQKQMLAIGRAIVEPRRLLLVDEPTKGLSPAMVDQLVEALLRMKKEQTTILLVEQNFRVALAMGDDVAVMDQGRIVHSGSTAALGNDEELQQRLLGLSMAVGA
jgi:branched-chain amino acid transport system ATP-binding protein